MVSFNSNLLASALALSAVTSAAAAVTPTATAVTLGVTKPSDAVSSMNALYPKTTEAPKPLDAKADAEYITATQIIQGFLGNSERIYSYTSGQPDLRGKAPFGGRLMTASVYDLPADFSDPPADLEGFFDGNPTPRDVVPDLETYMEDEVNLMNKEPSIVEINGWFYPQLNGVYDFFVSGPVDAAIFLIDDNGYNLNDPAPAPSSIKYTELGRVGQILGGYMGVPIVLDECKAYPYKVQFVCDEECQNVNTQTNMFFYQDSTGFTPLVFNNELNWPFYRVNSCSA